MSVKVCLRCKLPKPLNEDEFHRNKSKKDGFSAYCKPCWRLVQKDQYRNNKEYYKSKAVVWKGSHREELTKLILEVKAVPCADCGVPYPHYVLEFDHVRGVKVEDISTMVGSGFSLSSVRKELEKCDVVCSNCHKVRHHLRRQTKSEGYLGRKVPKKRVQKVRWPDKDKLQKLVLSQPALEVAMLVGVSSVAVKKMCTKLGLETRPRGYWAKLRSTQVTPV